jgi:hypothetical protein
MPNFESPAIGKKKSDHWEILTLNVKWKERSGQIL